MQVISITNGKINHKEQLILDHINFSLNKGEKVYLIGKTGSGKSSLLKVLYGDHFLTSGEASVAGFDLNKLKRKEIPLLRRKVGIVFQDFQLLFDRNVEENLQFVLRATGWKSKQEIADRVGKVLRMVSLENKGYKMPHQLSGGEQQRLAIGRALLNNPDVLLADEPTGNLDPETADEIMELLFALSEQDVALIIATHDYRIIEMHPSRIIRCENGELNEVKLSANY